MSTFGPRACLFRAVVLTMSVSLTVFTAEMSLRLLIDRYQCDDRLGWVYRSDSRVFVFNSSAEFAHFVRFNGNGMRQDREWRSPADSGGYRIVVLGDSFSAGLQVSEEESFPRLLEQRLRGLGGGRRIEVWNAAVDGYGTAQSLRMYTDRLAASRPDIVLLGLFLANDLGDNAAGGGGRNHYLAERCGRPYYLLDERGLVVEGETPAHAAGSRSMLDRMLGRSELYANLFPGAGTPPQFLDWAVFDRRDSPGLDAAWRITRALVIELDGVVRRNGGRMVVLLVPNREEARYGTGEAQDPLDPMDFDRAHTLAERFLKEEGILYIDLYPVLRMAVRRGEQPYFFRDMHWNRLGHELVVDAIEGWMLERCGAIGLPIEGCAPDRSSEEPAPE